MTPAAQRYLQLEQRLVRERALGTLSSLDEDQLLEEMGDLWWEMTEAECDSANLIKIREMVGAPDPAKCEPAKMETCEWTDRDDSDYWWADIAITECGHKILNPCENSPGECEDQEHVFKFCPFCGRPIVAKEVTP